ncbi:MAG: TPM domain-containing protein [Myxococcota bacterium]
MRQRIQIAEVLGLLVVVLLVPSLASAQAVPQIHSPVVDRAGVLSDFQERAIGERLRSHYDRTGVQMAVLLVDTTGYAPIEDYSLRVASQWKGGRAGEDRGVLLTLAIDDRRSRLEVGYGLESVLTDSVSALILADIRAPLRQQRYGDAVAFVVDGVIDRTEHLRLGEAVWPTLETWWESSIRGFWTALIFGVLLVGLLSLLRRFEVVFMGGKQGVWAIVAAFVVGAITVGVATKGVIWHGFVSIFLWGGLLGLTAQSKDRFVWGVPLVVYMVLAAVNIAVPEIGEAMVLGRPGGSPIYTVWIHAFYLMFSYSLWLGATTEGGGGGGSSTYSSSGYSGGYSGGGYSGGGGSFGGGGASGGW